MSAGNFIAIRELEAGKNYRVTYRSATQRYDRYAVMTYLGREPGATSWSARPVAGTQTLHDSDITSISPAQEGDRICINERASSHGQSGS